MEYDTKDMKLNLRQCGHLELLNSNPARTTGLKIVLIFCNLVFIMFFFLRSSFYPMYKSTKLTRPQWYFVPRLVYKHCYYYLRMMDSTVITCLYNVNKIKAVIGRRQQ